ncbi:hypothetical protein B0H13DRAFT_2340553 [Mycena leptocephala]|nr:hypothetical protein B0H13DRAFT_2340553 [Mycena leptocephala]
MTLLDPYGISGVNYHRKTSKSFYPPKPTNLYAMETGRPVSRQAVRSGMAPAPPPGLAVGEPDRSSELPSLSGMWTSAPSVLTRT